MKRKRKKRKWIVITAGLLSTVFVMLQVAMTFAFILSMGGLAGRVLWNADNDIPMGETENGCACNCIWVFPQDGEVAVDVTTGNEGVGFVGGRVNRTNIDSQMIKLMEKINEGIKSDGRRVIPGYVMYGIPLVELSVNTSSQLYTSGETDIYDSVMNPAQGAGYYTGRNLKTGRFNKPASANGAQMVGPFQISSAYYDSWVRFADRELLEAAGGNAPKTVTNRGNTGQPLYLPDVLYGVMTEMSRRWESANAWFDTRYDDWDEQSDYVKNAMWTAYFCIEYHGGLSNLTYAKNRPIIFDYYYEAAKLLNENKEAFNGIMNWDQGGRWDNPIVETVINLIDGDGSKGFKNGFERYAADGSSKLIDWVYSVKVIYLGANRFSGCLQATGGTLDSQTITVPGYGATTGSLTDTGNPAAKVPQLTGDMKSLVNAVLPGAVACEERYHVRVLSSLAQAPWEGGWDVIRNESNAIRRGYCLYGVKGINIFTGMYIRLASGKFVKYSSYDESVIHHGINFYKNQHYDEYKRYINSYEAGAEAQINELRTGTYLGGSAGRYVENIKSTARSEALQPFNDLKVCYAYMEANGLMEKYNEAVKWAGRYEEKYGITPLSTGESNGNAEESNTGDETNNAGQMNTKGHWVCSCTWPCDKCDCHEGMTEADKDQPDSEPEENPGQEGTGGPPQTGIDNFKETPGVGQGLWNGQTTEELCSGVRFYSRLKPYFGRSHELSAGANSRNWRELSTYGVPYYSQGAAESWHNVGLGYLSNGAACPIHMLAHMTSALQQRLINPPEMACVAAKFGLYSSGGYTNDDASLKRLFNSFGYECVGYRDYQVQEKWPEVDKALESGIPVGFRVRKNFSAGNTHYFCIDAKIDGKYKVAQSSNYTNGVQNDIVLHTAEYLQASKYNDSGDFRHILIIPSKMAG